MRRAPGQAAAEPCRPALVVLDFDGTLTDADRHAREFLEVSREALARRLSWDQGRVLSEWRHADAVVAAWPEHVAWVSDGVDACPANADPYLTANSVTRLLLAGHLPGLAAGELAAGVFAVHREAYERVAPPFRPDAAELLEGLEDGGYRVGVVTNSGTRTVERLLDSLGCRGREHLLVRGDAAKFSVGPASAPDPRFEALPAAIRWPELARAIHARRGRYFDVLSGLWRETGTTPEQTLVVGDNFELDLVMPLALGSHAHLALRASTMPHEARLARAMARGDADASLTAVLDRIRG